MPAPDTLSHKPSSVCKLDLKSGIGLVIANMIGSSVFLSAGFMVNDLGPGLILLSWVVGFVIALAGSLAYAQLAVVSGRSGGEYRYIHDYLHPYLGYLAGWASLVIGFAAPVAVDSFVVGAFLNRLVNGISPYLVGNMVIIGLTLVHAFRLNWSKTVQNSLVFFKFLFILAFIAIGIACGSHAWPDWKPLNAGESFPGSSFLANQYWILFAFSGWNSAIYVAEDFVNPRRDVSKAILFGCTIVAFVYIAVNWIFVANLTPEQAIVVTDHEKTRITLAHLIMANMLGPGGAIAVSMVAILVFVSAVSAMTFMGPRVYSSMAEDKLLPSLFLKNSNDTPVGGLLVQSGLALLMLNTQSILDIIKSSSIVLMVCSMLTVLTVFKISSSNNPTRPSRLSLVAALFYLITVSTILLSVSFSSKMVFLTLATILVLGTMGYTISRLKLYQQ